jgi:lipoprotein-releasing system permease protein
MIVETKLKDIAIIKSCGAGSSAVALIFTAFGASVGLSGSCLGIAAGYFITININTIERWIHTISGIKLWLQRAYILNYIPNTVNWHDVPPIVFAAVAGCCLGAIIPAIVAARTKPIEILRYE